MSISSSRVSLALSLTLAIATAAMSSAWAGYTTAPAQPPNAKGSSAASRPLARTLDRLSAASGLLIAADSTTAYERVPESEAVFVPPVENEGTPTTASGNQGREAWAEAQIERLVRTLPAGTVWAKLYLPSPAPSKTWRGDDVAAYAFAQARLFGPVGAKAPAGKIEIMGRLVETTQAQGFVSSLGLRPVYLITNPKKRMAAAGNMPWAAVPQEQWATMSKEERKAYGQQQAQQIMALSPEERDALIAQIRQHDKQFDAVKDPLEKLIGHDL